MFELDIFPGPKYQHHLIGNKTSEPQEAIVTEYTNTFSYALEKIVSTFKVIHLYIYHYFVYRLLRYQLSTILRGVTKNRISSLLLLHVPWTMTTLRSPKLNLIELKLKS